MYNNKMLKEAPKKWLNKNHDNQFNFFVYVKP